MFSLQTSEMLAQTTSKIKSTITQEAINQKELEQQQNKLTQRINAGTKKTIVFGRVGRKLLSETKRNEIHASVIQILSYAFSVRFV
jgi:hypothetical protein